MPLISFFICTPTVKTTNDVAAFVDLATVGVCVLMRWLDEMLRWDVCKHGAHPLKQATPWWKTIFTAEVYPFQRQNTLILIFSLVVTFGIEEKIHKTWPKSGSYKGCPWKIAFVFWWRNPFGSFGPNWTIWDSLDHFGLFLIWRTWTIFPFLTEEKVHMVQNDQRWST